MKNKVTKAIIPAAGFGTRFLPATKAMAKEMLPIVDRPTIQFIVDEATQSGIEDILIIIGKSKHPIEDYFDANTELEDFLIQKERPDLLHLVNDSIRLNIYFKRQPYPNGLGDAVLQGRAFVSDEPFVVMLGDDLMVDEQPLTKQLIDSYQETHASTLAVMPVPEEETQKYGVIDPEGEYLDGLYHVKHFVEKPQPADAPSNLAIIGRYLLTPEIFDLLETQEPGAGNEIQLTDAIERLNQTQRVFAKRFDGARYDVGNKLGYMETVIDYGLTHPDIKDELKEYLLQLENTL
ncbi:MAG: UTP--glucose-1-phosphate uridylyltransferase GalU [Aerococcus sp.]|nr:UTP--glucose-1-phosphate uridylyltransferase GalU [Aerococcus sp.]